jgi:hypothetical protein
LQEERATFCFLQVLPSMEKKIIFRKAWAKGVYTTPPPRKNPTEHCKEMEMRAPWIDSSASYTPIAPKIFCTQQLQAERSLTDRLGALCSVLGLGLGFWLAGSEGKLLLKPRWSDWWWNRILGSMFTRS